MQDPLSRVAGSDVMKTLKRTLRGSFKDNFKDNIKDNIKYNIKDNLINTKDNIKPKTRQASKTTLLMIYTSTASRTKMKPENQRIKS